LPGLFPLRITVFFSRYLGYVQDYDETTPSVVHLGGGADDDFYAILQPYVKNVQMFYCPDRTEWKMPTGDDCSGQKANT
jgi:hypothetical protein